ncbi:1-acyl-sn-glycerol-3-phosphate acyltransferase [Trinorchestia longiramus]|nr:1-acyl-sn-glycerol-3-phosphate acyltransferase [Trinorchestia longiramus]
MILYICIGVATVINLLYHLSPYCRFLFKYILYHILVIVYSGVIIPLLCLRPRKVENGMLATIPLRVLNPLLGLHWEVRGVEHITPDRAAIVVANHQSSLDFLGMVYMWPLFQKISAIAKKEILYAIPFGPTAWLCGTRFIDRSNPLKAKQSMNDALDYVTKHKVKLWIFPEGTRNMKDEMLPFKKGAFHLALSGHLPILPVVYSSYRGFLSHQAGVFNPGNVIVTCLPPVSTEGLTMEDMPQLMEKVRDQMMAVFKETSDQVQQPYPLESHAAEKKES